MTHHELLEIANNWFIAFNNQDLEKLLALYDENAQHHSPKLKARQPETKGMISGKKALYAWWQDSFDRLPSLRYEVVKLTPYEGRIFMDYIRHVDGQEDMRVGETLDVKDGLIMASRVYHS